MTPPMMPPVSVRYEQAVYGSFPFWDKGYAILARSPGCRDEWIVDLRAACQRYGERPAGAAEAGGLLALKLPSGPWAIVGPCPQGCDDRGRPGALAFHALFLSGGDYRKAGAFPFDLASHLCRDWTAVTTSLPSGELILDNVPPAEPTPTDDPRAARIVEALSRGKRIALESPGPIDDLARRVWLALPLRRRARLSLATWTFANGNRHDLLALPRLAGVPLDRSYVDPLVPTKREERPWSPPPLRVGGQLAGRVIWLGFALISLGVLGFAWHDDHRPKPPPIPNPIAARPDVPRDTPPPRRPEAGRSPTAIERRQIEEGLISLAERFGTLDSSKGLDPDAVMTRLRERMPYADTLLTPDELADLSESPEAGHVTAWHDHILLFRPDRPLPADFAGGPLDWQLRVLSWSFHLDPGNRPAEEIPRFLSESLSLPFSVRSTPLADRHPALRDYARFLRRLPAR